MLRATPILLVALAGTASAAPKLRAETFQLKNGLRVIVHQDHSVPKVAVVTWFRVGSKDEAPGRTGFAHLFEHLMFKGSAHTPDGMIDDLVEEGGGGTNAFTTEDKTVYLSGVASNFLEQMLWLEADRLAGLTDTLDQPKLDNQRDVVRNERRQNYENAPYGVAWLRLPDALWPAGHGYHWPVIGYHEDLVAATLQDVRGFFRKFYLPNNATMVIAGDVDPKQVRALAEKYFGWIPRGPAAVRPRYAKPAPIVKPVAIAETDAVQVPRVYLAWRGPVVFGPDEPALTLAARILAGSKTSRLYKRLVFEERIAQDVSAGLDAGELGGGFLVIVTAKPGVAAARLEKEVLEEIGKLAAAPPTTDELTAAQNTREAAFLRALQDLTDRAVLMAAYSIYKGVPDWLAQDLARFRAVRPLAVKAAVARWLKANGRVVVTVNPKESK